MSIAASLLDVLYPPSCYGCDAPAARPGFCARCEARIPWHPTASCPTCARPTGWREGATRSCGRCLRRAPAQASTTACAVLHFDEAEDPLRHSIHELKYRGELGIARVLGRALAVAAHRRGLAADVVAPVPLHLDRLRWRGFNQALLLARHLGLGKTPVAARALVRTRPTRPQVELDGTARRANVAGAFRVADAASIAGKRIALVDDVMTTGATVDACSRALLRAGAARVDVVVVARAVRD